MHQVIRKLVIASTALGCLGLTSCNYRSTKDTYYLVATNLKLPYWKTLQDGFNAAAKQYGVTARIVGPEGHDTGAEQSALSDAIDRHPAGILVSVAEAPALQGDISRAIGAGIPVITVDSDAPNSERLYFIGTNNLEAGHTGGRRLVDRLHGKGNVVFYSIPGQPNLDERLKGYEDILATSSGIKIVSVISTGGESNAAFDQTEQLVHQTGAQKVDAFVCLESESGKAVAEVLKRNNLTDRVLIAMDVDQDTLNLIRDGVIDSTVSQKPYTMGYLGLKALDEVHHAKFHQFRSDYTVDFRSPFPVFVDTGSALIDKDNLSLYTHPTEDNP
jgi:ribose transport system substrate-binding protein